MGGLRSYLAAHKRRVLAVGASLAVLTLINGLGPSRATLPEVDGPCVVVLAASLPQPLTAVSVHSWFVGREDADQPWERWEVWQAQRSGATERHGHVHRDLFKPLRRVGGGDPFVVAEVRGEEARRLLACLRTESPDYVYAGDYWAYPGPNSNTYVDAMLRRAGVSVDLPATAIGKDYRGLAGVSFTSGGTGVQVESPLVGLRFGLREGVEVHVLSMAFGVDLWPPALILPFGDGRLGFGQ